MNDKNYRYQWLIYTLDLFWVMLLLSLIACGGAETVRERLSENVDDSLASGDSNRQVPQANRLVEEGEQLLANGDPQAARINFEKALQMDPNDARAHLDLGIAWEMLGDLEAAENAYRAAVRIQDDFSEALNNLGVLLRIRGELEESVALLRRAVSSNPDSSSAHLNLALALEDSRDLKGAETAYRHAIRINPQDAMTRANLGLLQIEMAKPDEAIQQLKRALPLAENNRPALLAIGNGLRRAGEPQAALQAMRAAIQAGDGKPTAALLAELALSQRASGDREQAIQSLIRAIEMESDYAVAHYLLANMLAAQGELKTAIQQYKRYLSLAPSGPLSVKARAKMKIAENAMNNQK